MTEISDEIDAFVGRVKAILEEEGPTASGIARIAATMGPLLQATIDAPSVEEPRSNIHEASATAELARGPLYQDETGLTLVRGRFGPEALTPIHSHGSWGVVGVYSGRDRYQIWRRLDDGDGPGEARLKLVEERILDPGDVVILPPPPQDIHAQQGLDGKPVFEYVLFGHDAMRLPRLYFDVEAATAEEVIPAGAR